MGTAYEKLAGAYLEQQGYEILEYNYRCRMGEIDIVARQGGYLVFVEVKYRADNAAGNPLEAVTSAKQRTISKSGFVLLPDTWLWNIYTLQVRCGGSFGRADKSHSECI